RLAGAEPKGQAEAQLTRFGVREQMSFRDFVNVLPACESYAPKSPRCTVAALDVHASMISRWRAGLGKPLYSFSLQNLPVEIRGTMWIVRPIVTSQTYVQQ
ncbi:hypothetical protein, partial [Bradyrhizobium pachyrhizi]|uniref:hypothetical protein n=1 Tax=Bradyrhizobium pachyrhizi TaxID=280333 RepID=UPI001AEC4162